MDLIASLKSGADVRGIAPEAVLAFQVAASVFASFGFPCVLTSALDGKHMRTSLHYAGKALDLRSPSWYGATQETDEKVGKELREALGPQYDVVVEGYAARPDGTTPARHIHVEHDPKGV